MDNRLAMRCEFGANKATLDRQAIQASAGSPTDPTPAALGLKPNMLDQNAVAEESVWARNGTQASSTMLRVKERETKVGGVAPLCPKARLQT